MVVCRRSPDIVVMPTITFLPPPPSPSLPLPFPSPSPLVYRSTEENDGREFIVIDADIRIENESKKRYAFRICCKGVSEMFFSADDEETFTEWLTRLNAASKRSTCRSCLRLFNLALINGHL